MGVKTIVWVLTETLGVST